MYIIEKPNEALNLKREILQQMCLDKIVFKWGVLIKMYTKVQLDSL